MALNETKFFDEDRRELILFYLGVASEAIIGTNTLKIPSFKQSFALQFIETICNYRKAVNRDEEFVAYAIEAGFVFENVKRQPQNSPFCLENLGVVCSTKVKDLKVVQNAARSLLKRVLRKFDLCDRRECASYRKLTKAVAIHKRRLASTDKTHGSFQVCYEKYSVAKKQLEISRLLLTVIGAMSISILGWEAKDFFCNLSGLESLERQDVMDCLEELKMPLSAIYLTATDFWQKLCTVEQVEGLNPKDLLKMMHGCLDTELRLLAEPPEQEGGIVQPKKVIPAVANNSDENSFNNEARITQLKQQVETITSQLRKESALVEHTKKLLEKSQEKCDCLMKEKETFLSTIRMLQDELQTLQEESAEQNDTLSPIGLRERLGEEAIKQLNSKKLLIIGGHTNTHNILKELFPYWEYEEGFKTPETAGRMSLDAICMLTSYCSHKCFNNVKLLAKNSNARLILCPKTSPFGVSSAIKKELLGKASLN